MAQPQALTVQQIQNYQNRIQSAGTLAQQKAAAIAVYQDLYAKGYNYAGWALGVAKGNTITGTAALDYLTGTALMGIDSNACRNLSASQIDKIRVEMAINTMEQMVDEARRTDGTLTQDLGFKSIEVAHKVTFESNGLSLSNWTLNTPMKLYRQAYGDAATEHLWLKIRETGGDGFDGVMSSTQLMGAMGKLAFENADPSLRQQAQTWMEQVPGTANPQALWRSIKLVAKWLGADVESIGDFSPYSLADARAQVAVDQQLIEGVGKHLQSQPVDTAPSPTGLDTPTRNSAALINKTTPYTTQFDSGGGVDDLWVVEKSAGRYVGTRMQFRADFVANNREVDPKTLLVRQGQTYYVPQRSANGTATYHYSSGAQLVNNDTTGQYHMVVPNTDGQGGQTIYSRVADEFGYTVKQVSTNAAGEITFASVGWQETRQSEVNNLSVYRRAGEVVFDGATLIDGKLVEFNAQYDAAREQFRASEIRSINGQALNPEATPALDTTDLHALLDPARPWTPTATALITGLDPAAQTANGWAPPQLTVTPLENGLTERRLTLGNGVELASVRDDDRRVLRVILQRDDTDSTGTPLWEVKTSKLQAEGGQVDAGLSEEERAVRLGNLFKTPAYPR